MSLITKSIKVKITFTSPALGTMPTDTKIHDTYIASKAAKKNPDEAELLENAVNGLDDDEKGKTIFPRDSDGFPVILDYQIKGFFKDACSSLRKAPGTRSAKLTAFKKVIDGLVFIENRTMPITVNGETSECQRPLRASTPQGERVSLACSEQLPAGSWFICTINLMDEKLENVVREWLEYGKYKGLLQWRNGGKGSFSTEYLDDVEE